MPALTASETGTKHVTLSELKTVGDLAGRETVGECIGQLEIRVVQGETHLFVLSED